MTNFQIIKRLYKTYTKNYVNKILISVFFSLLVAGSTSAIAWLLDPAIEKIFIEKDQTLILIIPAFIILAFATKGLSMYLAKVIMIGVAQDVQKNVQKLAFGKWQKEKVPHKMIKMTKIKINMIFKTPIIKNYKK